MVEVKRGYPWLIRDLNNLVARINYELIDIEQSELKFFNIESHNDYAYIEKDEFLIARRSHREVYVYKMQPIPNTYESNLIKILANNLLNRDKDAHNEREYDLDRQKIILSAICEFLSGDYGVAPILIEDLIYSLIDWMGRRNEGSLPNFSFTLFKNSNFKIESALSYKSVINGNNFERLNSIESCSVQIDKNGNIISYIEVDSKRNKQIDSMIDVPIQFNDIISTIARKALKDRSYRVKPHTKTQIPKFLTIMLVEGRDILIIKDGDLDFARRDSQWKKFDDHLLIQQPILRNNHYLTKSIYKSLLDSTFSYGGSGILVLNERISDYYSKLGVTRLLEFVDEKYIICAKILELIDKKDKTEDTFRTTLMNILGEAPNISYNNENSNQVSRYLLKNLLSIDGSLIVDRDGVLICVGAIIKQLIPVSNKGARTAAALGASKLGLAIKVSEDGSITGFYNFNKSTEQILEDSSPSFLMG